MKKQLLHVLIITFVFLLTPAVHAEDERNIDIVPNSDAVDTKRRIALVIGNGGYKSSPLKNPVNDAIDVSIRLESLDFDVSKGTNMTRKEMRKVIRQFGDDLKGGGVGLFYYSGHGMQVNGKNYLIPVDADIQSEDEVEDDSIDAGLVLRKMESAGNSMNMVFLDACRHNPFARSFRTVSSGLAQMDAPSGSLIVYATAPGSVAADGKGRNGIFTKNLLHYINTPGLEVGYLLRKVRVSVEDDTKGKQVPWESSSLKGNFYFAGIRYEPPAPDEVQLPRLGKTMVVIPKQTASWKQDVLRRKAESLDREYKELEVKLKNGKYPLQEKLDSLQKFRDKWKSDIEVSGLSNTYLINIERYRDHLNKLQKRRDERRRQLAEFESALLADFNEMEEMVNNKFLKPKDKIKELNAFLIRWEEKANEYDRGLDKISTIKMRLNYWKNYRESVRRHPVDGSKEQPSVTNRSDQRLGSFFSGMTLSEKEEGLTVIDVSSGNPGWDAGLKIGDIIHKINGKEIKYLDDYIKISRKLNKTKRTEASLAILRNGAPYKVIIKRFNKAIRPSSIRPPPATIRKQAILGKTDNRTSLILDITNHVKDSGKFDILSVVFPSTFQETWSRVIRQLNIQKEKGIQQKKDKGTIVTDLTRHGIYGFPRYDKYYIVIEVIEQLYNSSTKVSLKLFTYYRDMNYRDMKGRRFTELVLLPEENKVFANKRAKKFLNKITKALVNSD
jgi:uncharacterized caspase-like protein